MQTTATITTTPAQPTAVEAAQALRRMQQRINDDELEMYSMMAHANACAERRGEDDPWVMSYRASIGDLALEIEMRRATLPELRRAVALEVAREAMRASV